MGLARIAIATLAVVLALGLLVVGGVSLWGALTKDSGDPAAAASSTAKPTTTVKSKASHKHSPVAPSAQAGNTVVIQCLAAKCPLYVAGPGPTDVQFHDNLHQDERRIFTGTRLTVAVDDASTVNVTINGHQEPRGHRGEQKTYRVPAQQ